MDSLSQFAQLRSGGVIKTPAQAPTGHHGIRLADGVCTFRSDAPGLWGNPAVMRSEAASPPLPRYGIWRMRAEFMLPIRWPQDCVAMWFSATDDPGESKQSGLSVVIAGEQMRLVRRYDPAGMASGQYQELACVAVPLGAWHVLDLYCNLTPTSAGWVLASLNEQRLCWFEGPTWYADAVPPFHGCGVYGGWNGAAPMEMRVRRYEVTP